MDELERGDGAGKAVASEHVRSNFGKTQGGVLAFGMLARGAGSL
jgi:hypothetical protein